jgi:hypothetical protein
MAYQGKYIIDRNSILQKTYTLMCMFFAEKEISRRTDPNEPTSALKSLESIFFESETSKLLLEVAIALRVIDEQMTKLPKEDVKRIQYQNKKEEIDGYAYGLFDDLNLNFRQTCNKIIHSDVMQLHYTEGIEAHEMDSPFKYGEGDKEITWHHWNGYIRLCGKEKGKEWHVLLHVQTYVEAIYKLLTND